ncbi:hypothetical protein [uncultured Legionella sp.]|uniref:hypothetical protein n=1 Tax=uncultured Legionella sp. TaxID=210934 RepID=UPI00261ACEF2|nr:hypothetical protein [uncultured Legionella sp.]
MGSQSHSLSVNTLFDSNTPEKIIALDNDLRSLRAEIEVKIHNFSFYEGENKEMYLNQFHTLTTEIDSTINDVGTLVAQANRQSEEEKLAFYESDDMQKFYEIVTQQLSILNELKKKIK